MNVDKLEQGRLDGFEFDSDREAFDRAMAMPLDRKIEIAIATIRLYEPKALELSPVGYRVCDSYGKDSTVICELTRMAGVRHECVHNLTTLDPPELIQFGRKHHPLTREERKPVPMLVRMVNKSNGPPTRLVRWCCEEYKEGGGFGMVKIIGVRAAESARRAALWKTWKPNREKNGGSMLCPILYWTDADVWTFIRTRRLPYCCLYDEGFKRLGCVGCPLAGAPMQLREFSRWPKYEMAWRKAFDLFWERWHGVPTLLGKRRWFEDKGSAQGLWDWWISGKAAEGADGCGYDQMMLGVGAGNPDEGSGEE
jgi:phosphoadenosine phosphosulfate reductase